MEIYLGPIPRYGYVQTFSQSGKKHRQEEHNFNEYKMPAKCCSEFISKWTVPTPAAVFGIFGSVEGPGMGPTGDQPHQQRGGFLPGECAEAAEGRSRGGREGGFGCCRERCDGLAFLLLQK